MSGGFADDAFGMTPFAVFASNPETGDATPARAKMANAPRILNGDTILDADGNLVDATDPIDEEAAFFLETIAGHYFGDPNIGNSVVEVKVLTEDAPIAIRDAARRALSLMVERGDIENVSVTPSPRVVNGTAINIYLVTYEKTGIVRR